MKPILKIIPSKCTINEDFKYWICTLAEQISTVKGYLRYQMNPKKIINSAAIWVQLSYITVTLFKHAAANQYLRVNRIFLNIDQHFNSNKGSVKNWGKQLIFMKWLNITASSMNNKEKLAFSYPHLPNLNEGVGGREFHKI